MDSQEKGVNMERLIIDLLILLPFLYLAQVVYTGLKKGKAEVRFGITYRKTKQPVAYWTVIFFQSLIAAGLLLLIFLIHRK